MSSKVIFLVGNIYGNILDQSYSVEPTFCFLDGVGINVNKCDRVGIATTHPELAPLPSFS